MTLATTSGLEMSEERLCELETLCAAATPNPTLVRYEHGGGRSFTEEETVSGKSRLLVADYYEKGDREFYYAALTALPEALAEIRRLRGDLRRWRWAHPEGPLG